MKIAAPLCHKKGGEVIEIPVTVRKPFRCLEKRIETTLLCNSLILNDGVSDDSQASHRCFLEGFFFFACSLTTVYTLVTVQPVLCAKYMLPSGTK